MGDIPSPPEAPHGLQMVAETLRRFVDIEKQLKIGLKRMPQRGIPESLRTVYHEFYLTELSETFSKASHEGQYDIALDSGVTLLALYVLLYPVNYPQIGATQSFFRFDHVTVMNFRNASHRVGKDGVEQARHLHEHQ